MSREERNEFPVTMRLKRTSFGLAALLAFLSGGCFPAEFLFSFIFDPFCFSHLGEDPREFPDFETRLNQLRTEAFEIDCGCADSDWGMQLYVGKCGNGSLTYVFRGFGYGGRTDYFNADGNFIGLSENKDSPSLLCGFSRDWPRSIECTDPVVTEVICELFACESP